MTTYNPAQKRHAKGAPMAGAWAPDAQRGGAASGATATLTPDPDMARRLSYGSHIPYIITDPPETIDEQIKQYNQERSAFTEAVARSAKNEVHERLGSDWTAVLEYDDHEGEWKTKGFLHKDGHLMSEMEEQPFQHETVEAAKEQVDCELSNRYGVPLSDWTIDVMSTSDKIDENERLLTAKGKHSTTKLRQMRDEMAQGAVDLGRRLRHETWKDLADAGYPDARITLSYNVPANPEFGHEVTVNRIVDRDGTVVYGGGPLPDKYVQQAVENIEERHGRVLVGARGGYGTAYEDGISNLRETVLNAETNAAGVQRERYPLDLYDIDYSTDHYPNTVLFDL